MGEYSIYGADKFSNSIPSEWVAGAAESIIFPERAQSCHVNNQTPVIYNRFTSTACVSSSQRFTNTTMFFRGELHSGIFVALISTEFSAKVGAHNVGSKSYKSNYWFFFGEKLVRKSRSVLGYNASENKYKDNPGVPFQHPSSHLLALHSFIILSRSWNCADNEASNSQWWKLDSTNVWNYLVSFYDF